MKKLIFKSLVFILLVSIVGCTDDRSEEESLDSNLDIELRHDFWDAVPPFRGCDAANLFICADECFRGTPWECGIRSAIGKYNNLPDNIGIGMTLVFDCVDIPNGDPPDIVIVCADIDGTGQALALPNSDGSRVVEVNLSAATDWPCPDQDDATCCQLSRTIIHELGHALGFGHTPYGNTVTASGQIVETHIKNTPYNDKESIFNALSDEGLCQRSCDFSEEDITALGIVYPQIYNVCSCPELIDENTPPSCDCPTYFPDKTEVTCYCVCYSWEYDDETPPNILYTEDSRTEVSCASSEDICVDQNGFIVCQFEKECTIIPEEVVPDPEECFCSCKLPSEIPGQESIQWEYLIDCDKPEDCGGQPFGADCEIIVR